ncbi:MAG: T9SS type A sorting domain-containing protein [Bacteroidia bacterium]|nr:T9SS type A sorting domain-containing protein [Bacteroidia bacterium]
MRKYFFAFIFCVAALSCDGQITFQKTITGISQVKKTNDGGFIACGYASTPIDTMGDIYLVKLDGNYDTMWTSFAGRQGNDAPLVLLQNADSTYFVGGSFCCSLSNYYDFILYKFDKLGHMLWVRNYGTIYQEDCYDMIADSSGGVLMAGMTRSSRGYVIKIDSAGNILWSRSFYYGAMGSIHGIKRTFDNNYILFGSNSGSGVENLFLIKISQLGNIIWSKILDSPLHIWAWSIDTTNDGGFILGAYAEEISSPDQDFLIIKTDSVGAVVWSKEYGGNSTEALPQVIQTSDGGYLAAASSYSFWYNNGETDGYAIKLNAVGDTLWTRVFGDINPNGLRTPIEMNDKGFLFVCFMSTGTTLIKTDSMGISGCRENITATHIVDFPITEFNQTPIIDSGGTFEIVPYHSSSYQGTFSYYCFYQSVNDNASEKPITLSPNPATTEIRIQNSKGKIDGVEIYDVLGKKCLTPTLSKGEGVRVDVSSLASGMYFVKVRGGKEERTLKFFKL